MSKRNPSKTFPVNNIKLLELSCFSVLYIVLPEHLDIRNSQSFEFFGTKVFKVKEKTIYVLKKGGTECKVCISFFLLVLAWHLLPACSVPAGIH